MDTIMDQTEIIYIYFFVILFKCRYVGMLQVRCQGTADGR